MCRQNCSPSLLHSKVPKFTVKVVMSITIQFIKIRWSQAHGTRLYSRTPEAEAGGAPRVLGQPGLHRETLSGKTKQKTSEEKHIPRATTVGDQSQPAPSAMWWVGLPRNLSSRRGGKRSLSPAQPEQLQDLPDRISVPRHWLPLKRTCRHPGLWVAHNCS